MAISPNVRAYLKNTIAYYIEGHKKFNKIIIQKNGKNVNLSKTKKAREFKIREIITSTKKEK